MAQLNKAKTINFKFFRKIIAKSSTPEQLTETPIFTTEFEFHPLSTNSGSVYLGDSTVTSNSIPRAAGTSGQVAYNADDIDGEAKFFDLSKLYVYGTLGDIVIVQYRVND